MCRLNGGLQEEAHFAHRVRNNVRFYEVELGSDVMNRRCALSPSAHDHLRRREEAGGLIGRGQGDRAHSCIELQSLGQVQQCNVVVQRGELEGLVDQHLADAPHLVMGLRVRDLMRPGNDDDVQGAYDAVTRRHDDMWIENGAATERASCEGLFDPDADLVRELARSRLLPPDDAGRRIIGCKRSHER